MKDPMSRIHMLLDAAWPGISRIDWTQFGDKLVAYDKFDVPKGTGIITHYGTHTVVGACTRTYGFLPRPEQSAQIVVKKVRLLQEHPQTGASLEVRNPDANEWGGAIRFPLSLDESFAISGLPEIGDHLVVAQVLREAGVLMPEKWRDLTDPSARGMQAAREYVGMSIEQYKNLKRKIFDIVEMARTLNPPVATA